MTRTHALIGTLKALLLAGVCATATAQTDVQRTKYWTGGSGAWDDAARWSLAPGGAGGAGVPRVNEDVVIAPTGAAVIEMPAVAWCRDLRVEGAVQVRRNAAAELNIAGDWILAGAVRWDLPGEVRLVRRKGTAELDLRGVPLAARLVFDGAGAWSLRSDLVVTGDVVMKQGTLLANGQLVRATGLDVAGRGTKRFIAGGGVVMLDREPAVAALQQLVAAGPGSFVVAGRPWDPGLPTVSDLDGQRDINICGTGPGQTPFTVDAQVVTSYNGFGVRCRGECNATVTVTVSGGIGPFTYQWLNGGPTTATWTTACGGPQIVIVTDLGQGVSCPVSVNVSEPSPLGVIFLGAGTPPTCPDVCDGSRSALAVGGVNPITYNWNSGAGTGSSFFQLCAGLNTLVITDANGCQFDTTFFFNLQPLQPNLSITPSSCFGECDGTASVSPAGGTQPYTITWAPPPPVGQGTTSVSGLCPGNWSVTIADANGCDTTVTFVVDQPPPIVPGLSSTDATCSGTCDGSATVAPTGAVGPYTFNWSPAPGAGQGTANATGLCQGTYTVTITDVATGCDTVVSVLINAPPAFDVSATVQNASCSDVCDGGITVVASGGTPPFAFSWNPAPPVGQGTATIAQLCPGTWTLLLSDAAGCDTTLVFEVQAPPPLDAALTITPVTCAGECDGGATVTVSGGTGPYAFLWNPVPPTGQGIPFAGGLCAGNYTLLILDVNGCDTTLTFTIDEPPPLEAIAEQTDVTCGGLCDGTATVTISGGTPPYTYAWSPAPPAGQGTATASGLCAGPVSVLVTDAAGCTLTVPFTIDDPGDITISLQVLPASCPSVCDGSAGVIAGGGTPPFTYQWSPEPGGGQGTPNATGLCPQAYLLTVTDAAGCDTTIAFTVDSPDAIVATANITDASCAGTCDGAITVNATGGNGTYTYAWSPAPPVGQGTATASGLCAGLWSVTVTSGGCDSTFSFTINEPPPLQVELVTTDATCAGECDGGATVTVSGGTGPYAFLWNPVPPTGQGIPFAGGLCAGNYTLQVLDANGCDTTLAFTINEPPPLEAITEQTDVTCGGLCDGTATVTISGGTPPYTYAWSPAPPAGQGTATASGLCAGPVSVLVTDAAGCTLTVPFAIDDPGDITISLQVLPASCPNVCDGSAGVIAGGGTPPFTYQWSPEPGSGQGTPNVTGLCAQAYLLTVTDAAGCDTTIAFTVDSPDPIAATADITDASCAGTCDGTIAVTATGGNGTYTYAWSPAPPVGQGTATASGLCAGLWSVTITSGGCDSTFTFEILEPLPLQVDLLTTDVGCAGTCDGTATATVAGGTPGYTFTWSPAPGLGQGTPVAGGLCPGAYTLTVADALGCDTVIAFTILDAQPIPFDLVVTEAGCDSLCAGTAIVTVTGGTGPFTYLWGPGIIQGQGTPAATALCTGFYTLTIADALGCDTTVQFFIASPSDIEVVPTVTDESCAGACDGAISVVASAGVPPYAYLWTPEPPVGQGTPAVSGLCPGVWTLRIVDAVACDTLIQFTVNGPPPIVPNASFTNESCNGPCDGTATVAPTGGVGPFSFQWTPVPPSGQGLPAATGLCPGTWNVLITDASGCDTTVTFIILPQQAITVDLVVVDPLCAGVCDGTATVTPSGGVEPYTFLWSPAPPSGQGTATVEGLCPGNWQVLIADAAGCDTTITFAMTAPPAFDVTLQLEPEDCSAPCTGSATVSATGGTGAFAILWDPAPGAGQGTATATGLCAGTNYTVTLTDAAGCDTTLAFTIDPFEPIVPNSSSTPVSCFGACDGTATVGPTGGQPPFTYQWSPEPGGGQGTPQATGLCAGVVEVTITDADGCQTVASILILGPDPLDAGATVIDVSCQGACDGTIVLAPQGGTAPYQFVWSPIPPNGQGNNAALGLCPGTWNATVIDANGCTLQQSFTIVEPPALTLALASTPSECLVCSGAVTATIGGGVPPYSVQWTDANGNTLGTGETVSDLCAGLYTATVTDANGCTAQATVGVSDADGEVVDTVDGTTTCPNTCDGAVSVNFTCADPPCTVAWSDANGDPLGQTGNTVNGLCAGTYLVSVTNASGCITIEVAEVVAPPAISTAISSSPVTCAGACDGTATVGIAGGVPPFTFVWDPAPATGQGTPFATGLCAGVYSIAIADGQGCDTTVSVLILEPTPLLLDAFVQDITCQGQCDGAVVMNVQGGTAPYTYTWSPVPPNGQGSNGAFGLCAGTYAVTVTDANGCTVQGSWTLSEPDELQLSVSGTPSSCLLCDGTAQAIVSGGTAPYTYAWSLGGVPVSTDAAPTALCSGLYQLLVTDANGCSLQTVLAIPDADGEVLDPINGQASCANDCDGTVGVDFTCGAPPCTVVWTDDAGVIVATGVTVVPDLCVGTYTVQVTNADGCASFANAEVLPSQVIVPNLSSTAATCAGVCDGTATVGPTGGVPPYGFVWSPEPVGGQGTPQATGLCAGVYSVLITEATGCDTTVTVLILDPQPLSVQATVFDVTCADLCDGSIVANVQGGIAPYTYAWDPVPPSGQGSNGAFGLCPDTYTLVVSDANTCTLSTSWTVAAPAPLVLTGSATPSECGNCIGAVDVVADGGTPAYTYFWTLDGAIIGTGPSLDELCAGLYVAQVIDANACPAQLAVPVSDSDGEETTTTNGQVTCPGDCDGEVAVDLTCSDPPCTITWTDAVGAELAAGVNALQDLCEGTYFVLVSNATGCLTIDTAFVGAPDPIVANLGTTPVSCFGVCDGTATVGPTGGAGGYTYTWDPEPGSGQGTPQAGGLCAGAYTVTITDVDGCSITQGVLILGPDPLVADSFVQEPACNGVCEGSIVVTPSGGTAPYTYAWSPEPPSGQGSNGAFGLCAGAWSVTVTDANGCTLVLDFLLQEPDPLVADLATTDITCAGDCEGTAIAIISGGVGPYATVWTDAAGTPVALNTDQVSALCAGQYLLTITDANACVLEVPFIINEAQAIDAGLLVTGETCFGPCDGTASVSPSGGTAPYTYLWSPVPPDGQGTPQVSGLCAGSWSVTITDQAGCDTTVVFLVLPYEEVADNATVTNVPCNGDCSGSVVTTPTGGIGGYTWSWAPEPPSGQGAAQATGLCPGTWEVTITDDVGCGSTFSYTITEPPALQAAVDAVTPASCADAFDGSITATVGGGTPPLAVNWSGPGGFSSTQTQLDDLAPGTYVLTVTDGNGCTITTTVEVDALANVVADAGGDQQVCAGGAVVLDGSNSTGAVDYVWSNDLGEVVGTDPVITVSGLAPGTWTFTLTVSDGPCSSADLVTVTILALPLANAGPDQSIFLSGTATLGGSPTAPPGSTIVWSPDSLLNDASAPNPVADPAQTTWFFVTVTSPDGCISTDSVLVTVVPDITIPSGFTPNGDGWNDTWIIDFIDLFPNVEVEIYNRWGEMLFQSVGYRQPWDGRYKGGLVPVGTYYYVVKLNDPAFPEAYTGPLTVIR